MRSSRSLLGPIAIVGAWLAAATVGFPSRRVVPTVRAFVETARDELSHATIWLDAGATLLRATSGLAVGVVVGAALGFVLGRTRSTWRAAEPSFEFVRAVPPVLTFPAFLLTFGYGEASRIAAIAFAASWIVALHVAVALDRAPRERREAITLAGLRGASAFVAFDFFEALPSIFTGARLALAASLVVAVVTEMLVGADRGLGARAVAAQLSYRPDLLWLVIAFAGALGNSLSRTLVALERRLLPWT